MSNFGEHLRKVREAKEMTSYRLAQLTGLSKQGVLNLEAKDADPKLSTLVKLANALGVQVWELVPGRQKSTVVDQPGPSATSGRVGNDDSWFTRKVLGEDGKFVKRLGGRIMRVWTEDDDKQAIWWIWRLIQGDYESALEGNLEEAVEGLKFIRDRGWRHQPSISVNWHRFRDDMIEKLGFAIEELEGPIARKFARFGKVTAAIKNNIDEEFQQLRQLVYLYVDYEDLYQRDKASDEENEEYEELEKQLAEQESTPVDQCPTEPAQPAT